MTLASNDRASHPTLPVSFPERVRRFFKSPFHQKVYSFSFRVRRRFPHAAVPLRLPIGVWWIAQNSALDNTLFYSEFEAAEIRFVEKFLKAGMTVLDIGAHHGIYTLLASKKVGRTGRVIAFEPSPHERKRLRRHVKLNLCRNVLIEPFALGAEHARATFFIADGSEDWCNSLRRPAGSGGQQVTVNVVPADEYIEQHKIENIDFIKMDVEGGELDVLRGASCLLLRSPRPVIMAEVSDLRTATWGYRAEEIVRFLSERDYNWFNVAPSGALVESLKQPSGYDTNLVALPRERSEELFSKTDPS